MKKIFFAVIFICFVHSSQAGNEYAILCGHVKHFHTNKISVVIYKDATSGLEFEYPAIINPDGYFKVFAVMEVPVTGYIKLGEQYAPLYLEPDDSLFITIDEDKFNESIKFSGKGSGNLNMYNRFFYLTQFLSFKNSASTQKRRLSDATEDEIFFVEDSLLLASNKIIDSLKKVYEPGSEFLSYMKNEIYYKNAEQVISFPLMKKYLTKQTSKPNYSKRFTDYVAAKNTNDGELSRHPDYIKFLNAVLNYYLIVATSENEQLTSEKVYQLKYKLIREKFISTRIQIALMGAVVSEAIEYGDAAVVKNMYDEFIKITADVFLADALKDKMKQANASKEGEFAPDFTLSDENGKKISLSSLKGKLVYIDVWATWCLPCMKELPYSMEMQKKFANKKDIVFMYVSIDDEQTKWKNTIKEKQLTGLHLISPGRTSEITKLYAITSIPRYIFIGKDGKIIEANAPQPSEKETEEMINYFLK